MVNMSKDEVMIQIVKEIDAYCNIYKIPPLKISNHDWDTFFDVLYDAFVEKEIVKDFYSIMYKVCRYTFAKALLNNSKNIGINNFIENLYYLEGQYYFGVDFSKREILTIQKEIGSRIKNVVELNGFNRTRK